MLKGFDKITWEDLTEHPVWQFANDVEGETGSEHYLRPVLSLPVDRLDNRIVGTELRLANGDVLPGILQNVVLKDAYETEHFVKLTIRCPDGEWFSLARYHDIDIDTHGPDTFGRILGLDIESIFPISYDISKVAVGDPDSLVREIGVQPDRPLDRDEIIRLAVGW